MRSYFSLNNNNTFDNKEASNLKPRQSFTYWYFIMESTYLVLINGIQPLFRRYCTSSTIIVLHVISVIMVLFGILEFWVTQREKHGNASERSTWKKKSKAIQLSVDNFNMPTTYQ